MTRLQCRCWAPNTLWFLPPPSNHRLPFVPWHNLLQVHNLSALQPQPQGGLQAAGFSPIAEMSKPRALPTEDEWIAAGFGWELAPHT